MGFRYTAVRNRLRQKSPANRAFTLLELMIVLVLIGIMSAVIIPEMKGTFEEALLRSTTRELVNAFSLASSQSVALNQLHRVRIDPKKGSYSVERTARTREEGKGFQAIKDVRGGEGELDTRVTIRIRRQEEEAPSPEREPEAPLLSDQNPRAQNPDDVISFYPDGTADPVEVLLQDRDGFRLALRINPTTARVRIIELERE